MTSLLDSFISNLTEKIGIYLVSESITEKIYMNKTLTIKIDLTGEHPIASVDFTSLLQARPDEYFYNIVLSSQALCEIAIIDINLINYNFLNKKYLISKSKQYFFGTSVLGKFSRLVDKNRHIYDRGY